MKATNKINLIQLSTDIQTNNLFLQDIDKGLSAVQKQIPSVYFYDKKGSELFEQICTLDEYYQTRTETKILKKYSTHIANSCTPDTDIIELGSGSSTKTKILLEAFLKKNGNATYYPIDISAKFLLESSKQLSNSLNKLNIKPIAGRYKNGLEYIFNLNPHTPKLVIWLGSSIGNLSRHDSVIFLQSIYSIFNTGDKLLIGMDLKKDIKVLLEAYNDNKGITAAFNKNLLLRINTELGGEFDLNLFEHRAIYNKIEGRIEMHLISKVNQNIFIKALDKSFHFEKQEYIHTENSYKYNLKEIDEMSKKAGFKFEYHRLDNKKLFSLNEFIKI